jgi:DNA-binding transcriptional ArsR family regulator
MDTITARAVADALGVSLPTAHALLDDEGVSRTGRGIPRVAPIAVLEALRVRRGSVPRSAFRRTDVQVLLVLQRFEMGLPSARAIAVRANLSPSTVAAALTRLRAHGAVTDDVVSIRGGRVRRIRVDPASWPTSVRNAVTRATVPTLTTSTRPMPRGLRPLLRGAQDEASVARALLRSPDPLAWAWAVANVPEAMLKDVARHRGLNAEARLMVHRTLAASVSSTNGLSSSGGTPT